MAKDDFTGVKRYIDQTYPIELAKGVVISIDMKNALVKLNNSQQPQYCDYPNEINLSPGDTVVLWRSTIDRMDWCVLNSLSKKGRVSNNISVEGNSRSSPYVRVATGKSIATTVNSTSWIEVMRASLTFHGGIPLIVYNGQAAIAGSASILHVAIQIGDAGTVVYCLSVSGSSNTVAASFTHLGANRIYGLQNIRVLAACGTAARTFTFTNYSMRVAEI